MKRLSVRKPRNLNDVYRRIFTGSMPSLYADEGYDWEKYYYSYVNTYLERDVRELAQVGDIMEFYDFMTVVAAYTSKPVVYEQLAVNAGISAVTAKKWLSILVASNIVALIQPYHSNALTRAVKMPLLHFLDTGLAAYLLRWSSPETLEKGLMSGAFFETYVFSEIYKSYINAGKDPRFITIATAIKKKSIYFFSKMASLIRSKSENPYPRAGMQSRISGCLIP